MLGVALTADAIPTPFNVPHWPSEQLKPVPSESEQPVPVVTEFVPFPGTENKGISDASYVLTFRVESDGEWDEGAMAFRVFLVEGQEEKISDQFVVLIEAENDGKHITGKITFLTSLGGSELISVKEQQTEFDVLWIRVERKGSVVNISTSTVESDPAPESFAALGSVTMGNEKTAAKSHWPRIQKVVDGEGGLTFSKASITAKE